MRPGPGPSLVESVWLMVDGWSVMARLVGGWQLVVDNPATNQQPRTTNPEASPYPFPHLLLPLGQDNLFTLTLTMLVRIYANLASLAL